MARIVDLDMGTNIANIKVSQCDNALYSKQHLNNI